MKLILVAANISDGFQQYLLHNNFELDTDYNNTEKQQKAVGIITSTKLNIDKQFVDNCTQLKWIARLGSGMEIIDVDYCKTKNIYCCSAPAGIANAVAEHIIGMLISLQKNIVVAHNQVANKQWIREPNRGLEIEGSAIGIIGFGNTGQAVAHKLSVFGCKILVYDKYKTIPNSNKYTIATLSELYNNCDIVSYHVPLNTETQNMYDAQKFAKPHILINTSRGLVCSTQKIIEGITSKKITALCLDVLDAEEKMPFSETDFEQINTMRKVPHIITPHIAGYTYNAIFKMCQELMLQLHKQELI
jgi:D-3-phosphoglycerate dehydrogenase / 2-oxoglutarate reductase